MNDPQPQPQHAVKTLRKAVKVVYGPTARNEVREIPCESWDDFAAKVRVTHEPLVGRVFRGQCESTWGLQSKWDRYADQKNKIAAGKEAMRGRRDTPDSLLELFKDRYIGASGIDTSSMDDEQWMALGRHHGLITPLLDWSHSPFVAAFFAFRDLLPIDPGLGCLDPLTRVTELGSVAIWQLPLISACNRFDHFKFVTARHEFAHRQRAQSGLFTLVDSPEHKSVNDYLESNGYLHCLTRYDIPRKDVMIAMQDLTLMNITESTMFPDAGGAARRANLGEYFDWAALLEHLARDGE